MPASRHPPRRRGFTLLEVAIVLALLGIVAAVAVPSYHQLLARQQLRAAGEALALDLRMAREMAQHSGKPSFVSFAAGPQWCWGVSRGQPCDCASGVPACNLARSGASDYGLVQLQRADALEFEPTLGRAEAAGAAELATRQGHSLQVRVGVMGRAAICGPDAPRPGVC